MYDPEDWEPQEQDEFTINAMELIKNEVRAKMGETVDSLDRQIKVNEKLNEKNREMAARIRNFEKELEQARKEGMLEGERKFGLGVAVNDTVYYMKDQISATKCEICNATGKHQVKIAGKLAEVNCPHCSYGKVQHHNYVPFSDTVTSLRFWISQKERGYERTGSELKEEWDIEVYLNKHDGSKNRKYLYTSLEECQAACDEKNKPQ